MNDKILVTGGAGFIGSEFVRQAANKGCNIAVVDKLTYAADLERLKAVKGRFKFYEADICNKKLIESIFKKEKFDAVAHLAAETHVDRSIINSQPFIETNIKGTTVLLDLSRKYKIKRFIHISTDEVYGDIEKGRFLETNPIKPNSPYAASKASADLLINAYIRTYDFPAIIIRPSNNYGPWQYPEKLIPLTILRILKNKRVPVYAKGENIREWLYVSDCIEAVTAILENGKVGEVYNIGSGQERRNIDVVRQILNILDKPETLIEFVKDRPGHDFRYALNCGKVKNELGWQAKTKFEDGLKETVEWYIKHRDWITKHS